MLKRRRNSNHTRPLTANLVVTRGSFRRGGGGGDDIKTKCGGIDTSVVEFSGVETTFLSIRSSPSGWNNVVLHIYRITKGEDLPAFPINITKLWFTNKWEFREEYSLQSATNSVKEFTRIASYHYK